MYNKPHPVTLNLINDIQTRKRRIASFLGYDFIVNPNVFPIDSPFSYSSKVTAEKIPENCGTVLDIGTGTGVQAIISAKRGAKKVVTIDIDNNSLNNAQENVDFHKLNDIIEVRKSDLFKNIDKNEEFDLIISQLPFTYGEYDSKISHFIFDPEYKLHERFLRDAKSHLSKKGKIFITGGELANDKKLNELIEKYQYKIVKIHESRFQGSIWKLYILTG